MTSETITSDVVQVIEARTPWRRKRGDGGLYRRPGTAYWWMRIPYRSGMLRESTGETDRKKAKVKMKDLLVPACFDSIFPFSFFLFPFRFNLHLDPRRWLPRKRQTDLCIAAK